MQKAPPKMSGSSGAEAQRSRSAFRRQTPSNPEDVMVIRDVSPTVFTCSTPFVRTGLLKIGGRCTIVRISTGSIAVFSPVALTEDLQDRIRRMEGRVRYIVVLNLQHHLYLDRWKTLYPTAEVVAPEGLAAKRDKHLHTSGVEITHTLTQVNQDTFTVSTEFDASFELAYFHMHPNHEIVVLRKASGSLIEADLIFNLPATEQYSMAKLRQKIGVSTKLLGWAMGISGTWSWRRLLLDRITWKPNEFREFKQTLATVDGWDFDRIIPCHGDIIEETGKETFRKLFQKFLPSNDPQTGS